LGWSQNSAVASSFHFPFSHGIEKFSSRLLLDLQVVCFERYFQQKLQTFLVFLIQVAGSTAWIRFLAGQDFSLLHNVQTGSGAHPASYPMSAGAISARVKRPGLKDDPSPPSSAEVKKMWIYISTPPYVFMA
jgi:hypothetical protein